MRLLLALIAGGLFGSGLFISGMTDTTKVQGWLDIFGDWDPTLAFVLGGAILPMMITPICVGLIFGYIMNPTLGILNYLLGEVGIAGPAWFGDPRFALPCMS